MTERKKGHERRWYLKYKSFPGHSHAIMITHDGDKFPWPKEAGAIVQEVELPAAVWHLGLQAFIDYFEKGIKPRLRLPCLAADHNNPIAFQLDKA